MLTIKFEYDIEEVVQITALDHLSVDNVILLLDTVLWRLDHCRVVELVKVELDRLEEFVNAFFEFNSLFDCQVAHRIEAVFETALNGSIGAQLLHHFGLKVFHQLTLQFVLDVLRQ